MRANEKPSDVAAFARRAGSYITSTTISSL